MSELMVRDRSKISVPGDASQGDARDQGVAPTRVDAAIGIERGHQKGPGDAESANAGDQQGQGQ